MLSKHKGNLGTSSVIKELHKLDLNVFIEVGDLSKIDLIVELPNKTLVRIQVKFCKLINGLAKLALRKAGPNGYRYTYNAKDVDLFALYCQDNDKVYWIPSALACNNSTEFNLRVNTAKCTSPLVRDAKEFEVFPSKIFNQENTSG